MGGNKGFDSCLYLKLDQKRSQKSIDKISIRWDLAFHGLRRMWINSSDQINTSVNKVCVVPAGDSGSVVSVSLFPQQPPHWLLARCMEPKFSLDVTTTAAQWGRWPVQGTTDTSAIFWLTSALNPEVHIAVPTQASSMVSLSEDQTFSIKKGYFWKY